MNNSLNKVASKGDSRAIKVAAKVVSLATRINAAVNVNNRVARVANSTVGKTVRRAASKVNRAGKSADNP
ncbi:hypothetical protein [Cupriavidus pauculus]|uniref:hypothetical protein n=1 Tax=Cupriavidus pauculus TaxID=82633 RepID=UPI0011AF8EE6|nr:hypothetical protein [Cupriavidus pauculus]